MNPMIDERLEEIDRYRVVDVKYRIHHLHCSSNEKGPQPTRRVSLSALQETLWIVRAEFESVGGPGALQQAGERGSVLLGLLQDAAAVRAALRPRCGHAGQTLIFVNQNDFTHADFLCQKSQRTFMLQAYASINQSQWQHASKLKGHKTKQEMT